MKILFAGHKARGLACLRAVVSRGHKVVGVVGHPAAGGQDHAGTVAAAGRELGVPVFEPHDINDGDILAALLPLRPDLVVLAGYGPILRGATLELAAHGAINLHGGKLPEYRGSSPLNWALINGEREFTLSIIQVDRGVDTGDILAERTWPIGLDDTVVDLDHIANDNFPAMLVDVLDSLGHDTLTPSPQAEEAAGYYPLRFPDDGFIAWDLMTADQVHNRIRALTHPFPGAFTFLRRRRVRLLQSAAPGRGLFGEPGRVYRKGPQGLLVCARDRCLWVRRALFDDTGEDVQGLVQRYEKFLTVSDGVLAQLALGGGRD